MKLEKKFELVRRNTEEIVTEAELKKLLARGKPRAYIGYAPTGTPHVGYLVPVSKILDMVEAGIDFTFLVADLHAHLDDRKTPWELLDARSKVYEVGFKAVIRALGGDLRKVRFVRGSSFQKKPGYLIPVLRLAARVNLARARRAASEVVRFGSAPAVGGFIYPLMQTWDVVALKADIALGGIDQRGIYMLAREVLPEFGQKKPVCVFMPLLPGLSGGKMSASVPESKINLTDSPEEIRKKVSRAFCPAGSKENNGVLALFKYVVFPWLERHQKKLKISRPAKFGRDVIYKTYAELEEDFIAGNLHPADLKEALAQTLARLLEPVRKEFEKRKDLLKKAF